MLLGARNSNEPTLSPLHPQLISGAEIGRRIIECASPYLNFVSAVYDRKDGRPTHGTEVAVISQKLPTSGLTSDRHVARLPHSEEIAERSGLLSADLAMAKADPHRPPTDLKLHLSAVAATRSLQHGTSSHWGYSVPCRLNCAEALGRAFPRAGVIPFAALEIFVLSRRCKAHGAIRADRARSQKP
jgi:hypothetical protein